jgi:membrane protein YqaA with SNARE-associated domain
VKKLAQTLIAWGPLGVLILAAIDSAGLPLPGGVDALLLTVSVLEPEKAYWSALLAVIGSLGGSLFLYWLARKGGQVYLEKRTQSARARRFREWFGRYGLITVFVPAFLPIPLPMKAFVLSAGALGVRPLTFALVVLAARIPRYLGLAWLGRQLGENSEAWLKQHAWHISLFALVLTAALFLIVKFSVARHQSRQRIH